MHVARRGMTHDTGKQSSHQTPLESVKSRSGRPAMISGFTTRLQCIDPGSVAPLSTQSPQLILLLAGQTLEHLRKPLRLNLRSEELQQISLRLVVAASAEAAVASKRH